MTITYKVLNGGVIYDLPDTATVQLGFTNSDVSGCTIKYPTKGVNATQVVEDAILIAYQGGVEMRDGRWWLQGTDGSNLSQPGFNVIKGKNLFDVFRRVRVVNTGTDKSLPVSFAGVTVGSVLNSLFTAAQARGAMTGLTWDFSATVDSAGVAWGSTNNFEFKAGNQYLEVIRDLTDRQLIMVYFQGTVIRVFKGAGLGYGVDHSVEANGLVEFVEGRDFTDAPFKRTIENRTKYALVLGDEGTYYEYTNVAAPTGPFGREETAINEGGTEDVGWLTLVGSSTIDELATAQEEYTRKLELRACPYQPHTHFNVGDLVRERLGTSSTARRLVEMVLDTEGGQITGAAVVFGTRLLPAAVALQREVKSVTVTGTGTITTTPTEDTTTPNPVTSLISGSGTYLENGGTTRGFVTLSWVAPTTNTNGSAINDLAGYMVEWKYSTDTVYTVMPVNNGLSATITNLDPTKSVNYRVRALDNANPPHFSTYVSGTISVAADTTAPSVPATPTTIVSRGTASVFWSGKSAANNPMESDFWRVEVHRSVVNNFTTSSATLYDYLYGAGAVVVSDQVYGTPMYYKFVAVDYSGNKSAASAQGTATTAPLVTGDLADLIITAGKMAANSVETDALVFGAATGEKIAFGVLRKNLIYDSSFEEIYDFTPHDPFGLWSGSATFGDNNQWRRGDTGGGAQPSRSLGRARSGRYGLTLPGDATHSSSVLSNSFVTEVGKEYRVTVFAASLTALANMVVDVWSGPVDDINGFGSNPVMIGDSNWVAPPLITEPVDPALYTAFTWTFIGTDVRSTVRIINFQPAATSLLIVDDISCVEVGVGGASELTAAGLRLFDNDGFEATSLVTNRSNYFSVQSKGVTIASVDDTGKGSFSAVSITGSDVDSDGDVETGLEIYGTQFIDWLDSRGRGIVARGQRTTDSSTSSGTEIPVLEIQFFEEPDRQYSIHYAGGVLATGGVASARELVRLRRTTNGTTPGTSSTLLRGIRLLHPPPTGNSTMWAVGNKPIGHSSASNPATLDCRLLITLQAEIGSANFDSSADAPLDLWVEDIGPLAEDTGIDRVAGSPPSTKKTYTKVYTSTAAKCYMANGSQDSQQGAYDMKQGYSSYDGDSRSLWIFPSMTSDLSGASVSKIRIYLYANHWYYNDGGTAVIKVHGYTSAPGSSPSLTSATTSSSWPKPGGRWVTLPSSLYAGFISGTYRGIAVGPAGTTSLRYYGRFNRDGAKIEVTYVK